MTIEKMHNAAGLVEVAEIFSRAVDFVCSFLRSSIQFLRLVSKMILP